MEFIQVHRVFQDTHVLKNYQSVINGTIMNVGKGRRLGEKK